jgi:uncharacterized protein
MNTSQPVSQTTSATAQSAATSSATSRTPIASVLHTVALVAFLAVWAYFSRERAIHMRAQTSPNHLLMYFPTLAMEWSVFGYIIWGVRKRGISLRELVGPRWSKGKENLKDLGVAAIFEVVAVPVLALIAHLLRVDPQGQSMRFMMPVGALELFVWVLLSLTAGICEETIFRGYFQRQFIGWTGSTAVGILISAVLFGAGHIYQGWKQTIVIAVFGAMFGTLAVIRRSLKPGMMAHSFQDAAVGIAFSIIGK